MDKRLILLLIFISISFSLNTTEFANQTILLNPSNCLTILDSNSTNNVTICAENLKLNKTIIINETNSTYLDNVTNNQYIWNPPNLPLIEENISCGTTYTNSTRNVSFKGVCKQNATITLVLNQTHINSLTGEIVKAPDTAICKQNISVKIGLDDIFINDYTNISVKGATKQELQANQAIDIPSGSSALEELTNKTYLCKQTKLGINKILLNKEIYDNRDVDARLECLSGPTSADINPFSNFTITELENNYASGNCTTAKVPMCVDYFGLLGCNAQESLTGNLVGCMSRIKNESLNNYITTQTVLNSTNNELSICNYNLGTLKDLKLVVNKEVANQLDPIVWMLAVAILAVGLIYYGRRQLLKNPSFIKKEGN